MLRPLPEQKTLIYFASGLRLNGTDNQAQLRATVNAAIRANVTLNPIDARGLVATAPLGDATQRVAGRHRHVHRQAGRRRPSRTSSGRRTRSTRWPRTPAARRCSTTTTCRSASSRPRRPSASYYIIGYYSTHIATDGKFRRVRITLERRHTARRARVPAGLLRRQGVRHASPTPTRSGSSKKR